MTWTHSVNKIDETLISRCSEASKWSFDVANRTPTWCTTNEKYGLPVKGKGLQEITQYSVHFHTQCSYVPSMIGQCSHQHTRTNPKTFKSTGEMTGKAIRFASSTNPWYDSLRISTLEATHCGPLHPMSHHKLRPGPCLAIAPFTRHLEKIFCASGHQLWQPGSMFFPLRMISFCWLYLRVSFLLTALLSKLAMCLQRIKQS